MVKFSSSWHHFKYETLAIFTPCLHGLIASYISSFEWSLCEFQSLCPSSERTWCWRNFITTPSGLFFLYDSWHDPMDISVESNGCLPIKIEWCNHWNPGTEHCCPVASCPMQSAPVSAPVKCPKLCLFGPCVGTSGSTKPRFRMVSLMLLMFTGYLSFFLLLLSCVLFFLSSLRMHSSNHTQTYIDTLHIYTTNIFRYSYTTIPWNHFWPSFTNPEG